MVRVTVPTDGTGSFDDFVRREHIAVLALAVALLRDEDEARDVAQETMARAFARWADVSALERPGAWSRRVALNLVTDRLRARQRHRRLLDRLAGRRSATAPAVDDAAWDAALWAHVATLADRQRSAVALRYVLDLAVDEIAEVLEVPVGTVKSDLSRARAILAERLGGER